MKSIAYIFVVIMLIGCSGKPSESEIKEMVTENILGNGLDNYYDIENFEKVNGFEQGDKIYIATVKYDFVFKKDMNEFARDIKKSAKNNPMEAMAGTMAIMGFKMRYGDAKAGDRFQEEKKITLINTEQGWRIDDS